MDTDSDSSDFILPATTRNNRNTSLPSSNLTKSPDTENADNKENLPLLLVQGVEENEQDDCYEEAPMSNLHTTTPSNNNSRPSRRTAVKTKATPQGQKPSTTEDEKQSNSRRKRDSKVLVESDSESQDDDDDSFSSSDAESSTFEDSESSDCSLNENTLKKQKARQESTKKTPKGRETKVKVEPKQKKATKAKTTKGVKSDNNSKSNIPVRSIRSGLSSTSQAKLESSRLLHVRPIRAGLSKKSPIPRLHSSF